MDSAETKITIDNNSSNEATPVNQSPVASPGLQEREGKPSPPPNGDNLGKAARVHFIHKWARKSNARKKIDDDKEKMDFMRKHSIRIPPGSQAQTANTTAGDDKSSEQESGRGAIRRKLRDVFMNPFINPMNSALHYWAGIMTVAVMYNIFAIIVRETFQQLQDENWKLGLWIAVDVIADVMYVIDMIIQSRTKFLDHGLFVDDTWRMIFNYVKSKKFVLDVISILPFDFLYFIPMIGPTHTIVRVNRVLRVHRVKQFFNQSDGRTSFPNVYRILRLILIIAVAIHWDACFYFLISTWIGLGTDTWVYPNITNEFGEPNEFSFLTRQYLTSIYWSTLTLTTIGEVPGPVTDWEYVFVIVNFLVGVFIFATVIGMVGGIITNMNIRRTEFQRNLDQIKQYMSYRKVSKSLRQRVIKWFNYLWTNMQMLNEESILETLPDKLHAEIAMHVHIETLARVRLFDHCETGMLEELVLKLKQQIFSPGEFVCCIGDIGKEMYIIKSGKLEVLDDKMQLVRTMEEGAYFGEISLLNMGKSGNKRTAHIKSVGYSDLFSLSKNDLLEVLKEYPNTKPVLEKNARELLKKSGNESPIHQVDESIEETNASNETIQALQERLNSFMNEYNNSQMQLEQRIIQLEKQLMP
jgi:cyclic nucleotide gated channel alpha 3